MKIKIQVVIETEGSNEVVQDVMQLKRGALRVEEFGLTLAEAKTVLQGVQQTMVEQQSAEYLEQQASCSQCGAKRLHKGSHEIVYRTLFGKLRLNSPRVHHCSCQAHATRTFSPLTELLKERTAPELLYVESKFAALMSYGLAADVLEQLLPIGRTVHPATVRNHVHAVAERMEAELGEEKVFFIEGCERDWKQLPQPALPLTVELDGGFVHSSEQRSRTDGWFGVITGKSMTATGAAKCFAFVNTYDQKSKRRLFELLTSQGMAMNQQVTFLSDGGDDVREVQFYLNPEAEYWLDWFHITMRLTVMKNMAKSLQWQQELVEESENEEPELSATAIKELERVKWFLWHGNVVRALESVEELEDLVAASEQTKESHKLEKAVEEFHTYILNNADLIPNYGERRRNGEAISTATAESTVNQVISKRMVKKQQMRWSRRGAHLLLQVRTRELNRELQSTFARWYPGLNREVEQRKQAA
jgi:hypothetical protein